MVVVEAIILAVRKRICACKEEMVVFWRARACCSIVMVLLWSERRLAWRSSETFCMAIHSFINEIVALCSVLIWFCSETAPLSSKIIWCCWEDDAWRPATVSSTTDIFSSTFTVLMVTFFPVSDRMARLLSLSSPIKELWVQQAKKRERKRHVECMTIVAKRCEVLPAFNSEIPWERTMGCHMHIP